MTNLVPQPIRRKQLLSTLAILGFVAANGCASRTSVSPQTEVSATSNSASATNSPATSSSSGSNIAASSATAASPTTAASAQTSGTAPNADQEMLFFETVEQCEAEATQSNAEYAVLKDAFDAKQLSEEPQKPFIQKDECETFMAAAQELHNAEAPSYDSQASCEAAGTQCEPISTTTVNNNNYYGGYRPVFGGSYFDPWNSYFYYGGVTRVYQPYVVYQSSSPGQVVSASGQSYAPTTGSHRPPAFVAPTTASSGSSPGSRASSSSTTRPSTTSKSSASPKSSSTGKSNSLTKPSSKSQSTTSTTTPQRPSNPSSKGTVGGRSSSGFGSTYKSTGRGGK